MNKKLKIALLIFLLTGGVLVTIYFSRSSNSSQEAHQPVIEQVIGATLARLDGKVTDIKTRPILKEGQPDGDRNHAIVLRLASGEEENASIFALWLNGQPKTTESMIKELEDKINEHLINREKPNVIYLLSGAMILSETDSPIATEGAYLKIDGKIVVVQSGNHFMPLPTFLMQTYTHFAARKEGDLVVLGDPHDTIRTDGREGFIFNLNAQQTLNKNQFVFHPEDTYHEKLPESGKYLILYRTREDAAKGI